MPDRHGAGHDNGREEQSDDQDPDRGPGLGPACALGRQRHDPRRPCQLTTTMTVASPASADDRAIGAHPVGGRAPGLGRRAYGDRMPQGSEPTDRPVPLPMHPDDVTPEWLTAALRSRGLDVAVRSVRRSGVGEGIGMMSGLERLDARRRRRRAGPPLVVLKMPARNDANRGVAEAFHLYEREVYFYRDLAPRSALGRRPSTTPTSTVPTSSCWSRTCPATASVTRWRGAR